jgi:anti-anti-sigma factor
MTTILAIEDEPKIRENIKDILELEGFDVLTAENGKTGVKLAQEHHLDLIICDVMMPELDGYDVLTSLRQDPRTIEIPFIFLSAKAAKTDFRKGMSLGADDYLTKPFTPCELRAAIAIRLEKQALTIERYAQKLDRSLATATTTIATPVKVIQPTGVLDVTNCSKLRQEIIDIATAGCQNVLIDCQNLTFMDSSGLAALVLAAQKVREANSQLSICSIDRQIEMLFASSSMDNIFEIFPTKASFYTTHNLSN